MTEPAIYDHVRPTDGALDAGVYRVVGADDETVTLLRVGDAEGRRAHTGEIRTLSRETYAAFEPAENPDGKVSAGAVLASAVQSSYWMVRTFLATLRSRPLVSGCFLALVVAGAVGGGVLPFPELVLDGLVLVGAIGLALVASGSV